MRLAVSVGCASGIGPEVSIVAASTLARVTVVLVGDHAAIARAAKNRRVRAPTLIDDPRTARTAGVFCWQPTHSLDERDRVLGAPTKATGAAQLAWINAACDLVTEGVCDALVTGPVNKNAIARSGGHGARGFLGHTEHLQRLLGAREVVMAFWSEKLSTSLVTTHMPLASVPRAVTAPAVARATFWLVDLLGRLGARAPRVAVASLNPHAGEGGLLGTDEVRIVSGIVQARKRVQAARKRAVISGPIPAETAMRLAAVGDFDGVVAMYHDQATIPMKLLAFGQEVNVSLGLPIVRTSVDHGTAYDLAPRFAADATGMSSALKLALRLCQRTG